MTSILDPDREFINKWEMYKLLSLHSIKNIKIPETSLLTKDALSKMLTKYPLLYLKSIAAWGGMDISTVQKKGNVFVWTIQGKKAIVFKDFEETYSQIDQFYHGKTTIIQRGIPAIHYNGCPFDIRSHLYKEMDGSWIYVGDLVRIGGEGSLVSNIKISNGSVKPTDEVIALLFPEQNHKFSQDILKTACLDICKMLDQYHFFTEVGLDLTLDHYGNLWIIEVNTDDLKGGPDPELFSLLPDQSAYERIMNYKTMIHEKWIEFMFHSFDDYLKEKEKQQD
ncbi:YheC/YheD family protein [Fredinandcohnia sp. QZ13]|uniref:YheC/YheD family protein n=1 Tax=Fredinandcohnia sp. QZ13 TaxID=3073144 RepID=UPI00285373B8|nr:YheC/YheD family protein [Fredinandcohnia sp. QZ13]MDR4889781.1 YheC/YheD family protein [Fredinandcohnia sp. QZ13]